MWLTWTWYSGQHFHINILAQDAESVTYYFHLAGTEL